ncbi:hypothetical protein K3X44_12295 [Aliiroseovarius crassostreae]|uniref:hypothetical protein n=1 Tax=Aliiroseovarius crassostreae TaxID=154981 RepID=UPI0021FD5AFD|nr:hypothetical protein [Aliiroseovarius crassostreae]UWQ01263.1 hypothetical protein K3X44_12295 [Aliiroseovarius crassostreae]
MSIANWIALVVPVIGLIGGALVYRWQKQLDRKNELRLERRVIYRKFASDIEDVIFHMTFEETEQAKGAILQLRKRYFELYTTAPDAVVGQCALLIENLVDAFAHPEFLDFKHEAVMQTYSNALSVLTEMRKDTFAATELKPSFETPLVTSPREKQ